MKELQVIFDTIRDVEQFVRIATAAVGSVRVSLGERVTNGKSIMGLITMGFGKPLTVTFEGEESACLAFMQEIATYSSNR